MDSRPMVLLVALLAVGLAGCADTDPEPVPVAADPDGLVAGDGRDLRIGLTAADEVLAPQWRLGDWFGHHVFFSSGDAAGLHIDSVVVGDSGDHWVLATNDRDLAMIQALFDIPILGPIYKQDLGGTEEGERWKLYDFPLRHGKTWAGNIGGTEFSFEATFNDAIRTPYGVRPGFDVAGRDGDGTLVISTDYVPEIRWYSHFTWLSRDSEDPADAVLRVYSMGRGTDWQGTYYTFDATPLVQDFGFFHPFSNDLIPGHQETFTVPQGADLVAGYFFAFSAAGAATVQIVDPEGGVHEATAVHAPEGPDPAGWGGASADSGTGLWMADPLPGEWNLVRGNAGFVAGGGVFLWSLVEHAIEMAPSAL